MADSMRLTIVLVPGAWMRPSTYENFLAILQKAGYPTSYASYPSLSPDDPLKADVAADSASIREKVMLPLIEQQGKEVVVVMHSYGGMPGSVASAGLGKTQLAHQGKRGGVVGLVFISGFVLQEGASVADGQGGALPPWVKENKPTHGLTMPHDPVNVLSADVEKSVAEAHAAQLQPHATLASNPQDQAIPKVGQEAMMQLTGQEFIVKELHGSHNAAFLAKPREAAEMVAGFIEQFLNLKQQN
ncbi:hypothetical protein MMC30_004622 [Trapelia coarctata]|nr:hypothetical protein [Trapelia coarctata]